MNAACSVNWQLVLEFLKVLTNWQLLVFIGCMVGGVVFKSQIGALIGRIARIEMFGGKIETATDQAQANSVNQPTNTSLPEAGVTTEVQAAVAAVTEATPTAASIINDASPTPASNSNDANGDIVLMLTQEQVDKLNTLLETERATTRLWEYRYLNYFFAVGTQAVLNWLVQTNRMITQAQYNDVWLNRINNPEERTAILNALENHGCIQIVNGYITVTAKGNEYHSLQERRIIHSHAFYPVLSNVQDFDYVSTMNSILAARPAHN